MRYIRYFFIFLLLLVVLTNGVVEVFAMNAGFSTIPLPEEDIDTILKNVNISILVNEPQKKAIECFDVNENGEIAIGCSDTNNKTVCIYTTDGDFQYGYSFECAGSFGIELDKNILLIYLVRSDAAIAVNPAGEVESVLEIQNTFENNSYWNDFVFSISRESGDTEYTLKNDLGVFNIFASSHSQLISINTSGEERIIYDVSSEQFLRMVIVFVGILVFVCIAVAIVIGQFIKLKRSN